VADGCPVTERRFGRLVEHDPRSRSFAAAAGEVRTVRHRRRTPIFDQGATGSCTGQAMAGALSTGPFRHRFHERTAWRLYRLATRLDEFPGEYPPDDNGSSGLAVAKAAVQHGYITEYRHAFDLDSALAAITAGPVIVGMVWLTGCDHPDESGLASYSGAPRGGHEVCAVGVNVEHQTVTFANSWGTDFGAAGYFSLTWDDFGRALADSGDVTIPVPKGNP